jgi:hypothetical protein
MKQSNIQYEILEDGTISIQTDDLAGPNHRSADELLKELGELLGGEITIKKRNKFHVHTDLSGSLHSHAADGHTHSH